MPGAPPTSFAPTLGPHVPVGAARFTRRWAERVLSKNPGCTITLADFVAAFVLIHGSRPEDNLLALKLHIVGVYLVQGHVLTAREYAQLRTERLL